MVTNLGNAQKGREVLYQIYSNPMQKTHLGRELRLLAPAIRQKDEENQDPKPVKYDQIFNDTLKLLQTSINKTIEDEAKKLTDPQMNDVKAYFWSKFDAEDKNNTGKKKGEEGYKYSLTPLFNKLLQGKFKNLDEKKVSKDVKDGIKEQKQKELEAKIAEEKLKLTPDYKINVELPKLREKRMEFSDANNAIFGKIVPYNQEALERFAERLKNCNKGDAVLRDQLIKIIQALISQNISELSIVDFDIFKNEEIKNFVTPDNEIPALINQEGDVAPKYFTNTTLEEINGVAEKYAMKDDDKQALKNNLLQIANLDKKIGEIELLMAEKILKAPVVVPPVVKKAEEIKPQPKQPIDAKALHDALKVANVPQKPKVEPKPVLDDEDPELALAMANSLEQPQPKEAPKNQPIVKQEPKKPLVEKEDADWQAVLELDAKEQQKAPVDKAANQPKVDIPRLQKNEQVKPPVEKKPEPKIAEGKKKEPSAFKKFLAILATPFVALATFFKSCFKAFRMKPENKAKA